MEENNIEILLKDITWNGSRYYINAQFLMLFVRILTEYKADERTLDNVFAYIHALKEQKKIQIYPPLLNEINEILLLEKYIQEGQVNKDKNGVLMFCIDSCLHVFTKNEKKLGYKESSQ